MKSHQFRGFWHAQQYLSTVVDAVQACPEDSQKEKYILLLHFWLMGLEDRLSFCLKYGTYKLISQGLPNLTSGLHGIETKLVELDNWVNRVELHLLNKEVRDYRDFLRFLDECQFRYLAEEYAEFTLVGIPSTWKGHIHYSPELPTRTRVSQFRSQLEQFRQFVVELCAKIDTSRLLEASFHELLKTTSVRGRAAFCITSLENERARLSIGLSVLDDVIELLWSFVESVPGYEWDELWRKDPFFKAAFAAKENFLDDPDLRGLPTYVTLLCRRSYDVIYEHFYGGIPTYSPTTYYFVLDAMFILLANGGDMPDITPFRVSSFDEDYGWGNFIDRSRFRD